MAAHADLVAGHGEARRKTLEVELEWTWECFVEVGDVEEEVTLRRGEQSEIGHVRVAAELDRDAGVRSNRKVRCHRQCGAAIEGERGDRHPAVADRHELWKARCRLALEQPDRVVTTGMRRPRSEGGRRRPDPGFAPAAARSSRDGNRPAGHLLFISVGYRAQPLSAGASPRSSCNWPTAASSTVLPSPVLASRMGRRSSTRQCPRSA